MFARYPVSLILGIVVLGASFAGAEVERPVFLDKEGRALPIQEEEQILRFLRTARVTASEPVGEGITEAIRLDLQQNDIRARAIFHHINEMETRIRRMPNGRTRGYRKDSFESQIAAYVVGRLLGVHNIPPTTHRHFDGDDGSAQLWIEHAMTEEDRQARGIEPPDQSLWNQLYADMRIFDNLINNIDRNLGNMLIDSQGHLWLIDHTRSLGQDKTIPHPEAITRCSNRLYQALKNLDEEQLRQATRKKGSILLTEGEFKALLKRRIELLEKIEDRIRLLGAESVLFDYGDPEPGITVDEDAG